jgi:hypothetical protein
VRRRFRLAAITLIGLAMAGTLLGVAADALASSPHGHHAEAENQLSSASPADAP